MEKNVTSGDRNLSGKSQYAICQKYRFPVQLQYGSSCVKKPYIKDN